MTKEKSIQLFQDKSVRTHWDYDQEKWHFSIVDVIAILTEQIDFQKARKYWNKLKDRLTNELTKAWSGKSIKDYKNYKSLKKENLRDHMSNLGLVLNMFAEVSTTEISKEKQPTGLNQNKAVVNKGGTVAQKARLEIEKQTGKPVISINNAKTLIKGFSSQENLLD